MAAPWKKYSVEAISLLLSADFAWKSQELAPLNANRANPCADQWKFKLYRLKKRNL